MSGLLFQDAQSLVHATPNRADVACFIGYVGRRPTPLSPPTQRWLQSQGWRPQGSPVEPLDPLLHTPVPVASFEAFDRLFAWDSRPPDANLARHVTWLGAAVRSFFRQGGSRCFVVRIGDPWAPTYLSENSPQSQVNATVTLRNARLQSLFPGFSGTPFPSPHDPSTWLGHGIILGLPEAATFCYPDLPDIVADATLEPAGLPPLPPAPEAFAECTPEVAPPEDELRQRSPSPACSPTGYGTWCRAVRTAITFLRAHRRDAHLLLALPLPAPGSGGDLMPLLDNPGKPHGLAHSPDQPAGIASAFCQLAFPWLATSSATSLPGGLEPPDGVFAGVLARTLPSLGVARSLGAQPLRDVHRFSPSLPGSNLQLETPTGSRPALIHRVSLLGPTPDGPRVLSDVTTSLDLQHRPACVGRLTAAILRTARQLGTTFAFESSDELLRQRIRTQLDRLLSDFYAAGALHGANRSEAYSVRCDATTTSPNDLDNGRIIAEIRFAPAHPVGLITVVLALRDGSVTTPITPP